MNLKQKGFDEIESFGGNFLELSTKETYNRLKNVKKDYVKPIIEQNKHGYY